MPDANYYAAQYYIVGDNDVWMVKPNGGEEAVVFAIDVAQKLGARGECAHVCVLDDHGRFQLRWSYRRNDHLRGTAPRLPDGRPSLADRHIR